MRRVLLPLLPDRSFGPWDVINPFRIGLLVVLISGLNLAGYAALKLLDHHHAVVAMGVIGGLVSSTATTLTFARSARDKLAPAGTAGLVVALANLTVLLRLAVIGAFAAPSLVTKLVPVLAAALLVGLILLIIWIGSLQIMLDIGREHDWFADPTVLALGISAVFHYVPLHSSPAGARFGRVSGPMAITESVSERLLRLPIAADTTPGEVDVVVSGLAAALQAREL